MAYMVYATYAMYSMAVATIIRPALGHLITEQTSVTSEWPLNMLNDAIRRLVLRLRESPLYALFGNDKPAVVRQNLDTFLVATALKCYDWQVAHREDLNARVDAKLTKEFVKELEEEHVDGRKKYVQNMIKTLI